MRSFASSLVFVTVVTVGVPAAFAQPEPRAAVSASVGVGSGSSDTGVAVGGALLFDVHERVSTFCRRSSRSCHTSRLVAACITCHSTWRIRDSWVLSASSLARALQSPQPIRAMAYIQMVKYWSGYYEVGTRFGLPRGTVTNTMNAIVMAESWFA